ncbi:hypothetical protein BV102_01501B, partial [Haemophilus influenzae]
QQNK